MKQNDYWIALNRHYRIKPMYWCSYTGHHCPKSCITEECEVRSEEPSYALETPDKILQLQTLLVTSGCSLNIVTMCCNKVILIECRTLNNYVILSNYETSSGASFNEALCKLLKNRKFHGIADDIIEILTS